MTSLQGKVNKVYSVNKVSPAASVGLAVNMSDDGSLLGVVKSASEGTLSAAGLDRLRKAALVDIILGLLKVDGVVSTVASALRGGKGETTGAPALWASTEEELGTGLSSPATTVAPPAEEVPREVQEVQQVQEQVQQQICRAYWRGSACNDGSCQRRHPPICHDRACVPRRLPDCVRFHLVARRRSSKPNQSALKRAPNRGSGNNLRQGNGRRGSRPPPTLMDFFSALTEGSKGSRDKMSRSKGRPSPRSAPPRHGADAWPPLVPHLLQQPPPSLQYPPQQQQAFQQVGPTGPYAHVQPSKTSIAESVGRALLSTLLGSAF